MKPLTVPLMLTFIIPTWAAPRTPDAQRTATISPLTTMASKTRTQRDGTLAQRNAPDTCGYISDAAASSLTYKHADFSPKVNSKPAVCDSPAACQTSGSQIGCDNPIVTTCYDGTALECESDYPTSPGVRCCVDHHPPIYRSGVASQYLDNHHTDVICSSDWARLLPYNKT
ncbi:hypothetical protein CcaCcLH18_02634 [Colletotrichum camelliae]|nr:hypothetical protein CcaCcLH18_02634 [Colletotrichum camelliae]